MNESIQNIKDANHVYILIIGGGGVFGHIPITFLRSLNIQKIENHVHVLGGTSIGGIISLFLASGGSPKQLDEIFVNNVEDVFNKPFWRRFNPYTSTYRAENIEPFLKKYLKGTMGDLNLPVFVPTYDIKNDQPKIFDNLVDDDDLLVPIWKVGRGTSAAPTFFPPFGLDSVSEDTYVRILLDGGVVENLPILSTILGVRAKTNTPFKKMRVLVLGTGDKVRKERSLNEVTGWSLVNWLQEFIVPQITKSNEIATDFWAKNLGLGYYEYFNPVELSEDWDMDEDELSTEGVLSERCGPFKAEFRQVWNKFLMK